MLYQNMTIYTKLYEYVKHSVWNGYFKHKGQSQSHKVVDLDVVRKGFMNGVCIPNMESLLHMVQRF